MARLILTPPHLVCPMGIFFNPSLIMEGDRIKTTICVQTVHPETVQHLKPPASKFSRLRQFAESVGSQWIFPTERRTRSLQQLIISSP